MNILGIDMGGTKVAIAIGRETGELLGCQRIPMNPWNADSVLSEIAAVANTLIAQTAGSIDAVGITAPGPMCSKRQMILEAPNLPGWNGCRVGEYFKSVFNCPIFMQNDANGASLAEYLFGAQKGNDLIYLTMSTGIGGGIICNGQLVAGTSDLAGEVGHLTLVPGGRACACGRAGCWEAYCGGKAFAEYIQTELRENHHIETPLLGSVGGNLGAISMKEICDAVRAGDAYALTHWNEFVDHMAHALGILIQTVNPEAIVMGTIAIHAGDLFIPELTRRLAEYAWSDGRNVCTIEPSMLTHIGELAAIAVGIDGLVHAT